MDEASARHPREVVTIENPMHDVVAPMPAFASGIDAYSCSARDAHAAFGLSPGGSIHVPPRTTTRHTALPRDDRRMDVIVSVNSNSPSFD